MKSKQTKKNIAIKSKKKYKRNNKTFKKQKGGNLGLTYQDICKIFDININNKIKSGGSNPSNGYANPSNAYHLANHTLSNPYNLANASNNQPYPYNNPQQHKKKSFREEYNNVQFSNHFNRSKLPNNFNFFY